MDSEKKDYIIQEAEAIVAECEKHIEENLKSKIIMRKDKTLEKKYKKLKSITAAIILIETIFCVIFAIK